MSTGYNSQKPPQRTDYDALEKLAMVVAAMLALLTAPYLNAATAPYVMALTLNTYGPDLIEVIGIGWLIACFLLVFFASQVLVSLGLRTIWTRFANRYL